MTGEAGEGARHDIRVLTGADIDAFRDMLDMFGRAFNETETYSDAQPDAGYLKALLDGGQFIAIAAMEGKRVIGGIAAYVLVKFEQARSEIYIYDLAVDKSFRRQGVATALIEAIKPIAREKGAWVIYIQADRDDPPAVALYTKLGRREDVLHFDIMPD